MTDKTIPSRRFAHRDDKPLAIYSETHGVHPSPDAIDGYYGIGWYEYFEDQNTGETYKVYCTDGVNGGRGPYEEC